MVRCLNDSGVVQRLYPGNDFSGTCLLWILCPLQKCNLELEARVGIARGSFTVPSLTHSVWLRCNLGRFHPPVHVFHLPFNQPHFAEAVEKSCRVYDAI